jgi:mannose-1-phosphate guanylyltransferase
MRGDLSVNGAVILAGGSGERLFPYSSATLPKQFLPLVGQHSMLQETFRRLRKRYKADDIYIITQSAYQDTVLEQLPAVTADHILLEPGRRDTAGAITLAIAELRSTYDVLLFCPADHHIADGREWDEALQTALETAKEERHITLFGIVPNYPETGYGYIEYNRADAAVCQVIQFHEKPSREIALHMVRSGQYLWNCGIFTIPCDKGISGLAEHLPLHYDFVQSYSALRTQGSDAVDRAFLSLPKLSIDYGLMEKMGDHLKVVPAYFPWSDLGSWSALERILTEDENGNHVYGEVKALRAENSIVFAPDHEVYLHEVSDLLVVCHENQVLVANKESSADMKRWLPELNHLTSRS